MSTEQDIIDAAYTKKANQVKQTIKRVIFILVLGVEGHF